MNPLTCGSESTWPAEHDPSCLLTNAATPEKVVFDTKERLLIKI